jgi:antitoxin PrlF
MAAIIEEVSTITSKGQTTVPKAVRQALGVGLRGKIAFRVEGGRVTVRKAGDDHCDPAIAAFLKLIERDIASGRNIGDLPPKLVKSMKWHAKRVKVDLDERLDGPVEI